jgi:hypothetical protein
MKPKQVTVGELARAYAKLKCKPLRMEWVDVEARRCAPFVALLIAARKMPARKVADLFSDQSFEFCCKHITFELRTHIAYVSGFELGFALLSEDEIRALSLPAHLTEGEEFEMGYADGRAAGIQFE